MAEAETHAICPAAKTAPVLGQSGLFQPQRRLADQLSGGTFASRLCWPRRISVGGRIRVPARRWWIWWTIALIAACSSACRGETREQRTADGVQPADLSGEEAYPPGAMPELVEYLRESLAITPHPSDGGGRAWLEQMPGDPEFAIAGTPGRFTLIYERGQSAQVTPISTPHLLVVLKMYNLRLGKHSRRFVKLVHLLGGIAGR